MAGPNERDDALFSSNPQDARATFESLVNTLPISLLIKDTESRLLATAWFDAGASDRQTRR
jgi:hypothetical protein